MTYSQDQLNDLILEAESGNPEAQCKLAFTYISGKTGERRVDLAFQWYEKAASNGNLFAQYNLADLYLRGEGVEKDYARAFHWFEVAGQSGDLDAKYNMGMLFMNRDAYGVEHSETKAFACFLEAAQGNLARAQYQVATMLRDAIGCAKDLEKAKHWFEAAHSNGVKRALTALEELA